MISASPAADTLPPLLTLGATVCVQSVNGERRISLSEFLKGPKATDLRPNEILTEISFKKPSQRARMKFIKIGRRNAVAISVFNMALLLTLEDASDRIEEARVALGAVAPTAIRMEETEKYLTGRILDEETIREAADMAARQCRPITDIRGTLDGRRMLVMAWLEKTLKELASSGPN